MEKAYLRRAEVAKLLGVPASTIKHWERSITTIDKNIRRSANGGYRLYTKENIACFEEVQRLLSEKRLSIKEVADYFNQGGLKEVISSNNKNDRDKEKTKTELEQKMKLKVELEEAIERLEQLKALL